ncbi:hypothetical protein [Hymenobacter mucosus]|uniref:Uncharacterized protein n=1 Tax=Hymenobacter mucosus TaxID=1411120 RepID=A0A239A962_9BACT|nr:hypothetical protein [Hymenobacter mucosus]SNR91628.1 hypothetical protein SAMN06269173_11143 [Hymenobacter mucosus]
MSTYHAGLRWVRTAATRLGISPEEYAGYLNEGKKFCGGCRHVLPRTTQYFYTYFTAHDGMSSQCIACSCAAAARTTTQRQCPANPPKPHPDYAVPSLRDIVAAGKQRHLALGAAPPTQPF